MSLLLSTSETLLHKDYPEILKMAEEAEIRGLNFYLPMELY